jgi:hypothetical protein
VSLLLGAGYFRFQVTSSRQLLLLDNPGKRIAVLLFQ